MIEYFLKPYNLFGGNLEVELDLSNYETKADLKEAIVADASNVPAKSYLVSLRANADKIDMDKLIIVPGALSNQTNVADEDVVKKAVYDKLVIKVNTNDTCGPAF